MHFILPNPLKRELRGACILLSFIVFSLYAQTGHCMLLSRWSAAIEAGQEQLAISYAQMALKQAGLRSAIDRQTLSVALWLMQNSKVSLNSKISCAGLALSLECKGLEAWKCSQLRLSIVSTLTTLILSGGPRSEDQRTRNSRESQAIIQLSAAARTSIASEGESREVKQALDLAESLEVQDAQSIARYHRHIAYNTGNPRERAQHLQVALLAACVADDPALKAYALIGLGNERINEGFNFRAALGIGEVIQSPKIKLKALLGLGHAGFEPEENFTKALQIASETGDRKSLAKAYLGLGRTLFQRFSDRSSDLNHYKEVQAHLLNAIKVAENNQDGITQVRAHQSLCWLARRVGVLSDEHFHRESVYRLVNQEPSLAEVMGTLPR